MKVIQVNKADQGPVLILAELDKPQAGLGEILIHVHAAGVTPTELLWYPTTHTKSGTALARGARARIFGSHHGDRQRCPGLRGRRRGVWHERLVC